MKIIRRTVRLKDGMTAELEEHPKAEIPAFYPEKTDLLEDGTLVLMDCHSKYYTPTPAAQTELVKKIQAAKSWGYLTINRGHERCA